MIFLKLLNRYFILILLCFGAHAFTTEVESKEPVNKDRAFANMVYSNVGIDHSMLTLGIGYGRYFDIASIKRRLLLFADYALPLASLDFQDFRVQSGLRVSAIELGPFHIPLWLSFNVSGARNKVFTATGLGSEVGFAPGYYGRRFVFAAEVNWDQTWAAYLKHSEAYRDQFYENAKDGWYSMTATSFRAGLHLAWHMHQRFTLGLKGGYQQMGQYNKLIPPVYCMLNTQINF